MRNKSFSKNVPVWAFAAVLVVVAPGVPLSHAASHRANAELLAAQLPSGETLTSAPVKDMKAAVRSAVAKRPADAADIVRIAIMAKTPKRHAVKCDSVRDIVDGALAAAPDRAREISEMAESLAPDCAQVIDRAVRGSANGNNAQGTGAVPGTTAGDGTSSAEGTGAASGFDAGFGPGFPGSPTFGGSSPSGGFALPPVTQAPVTPSQNR